MVRALRRDFGAEDDETNEDDESNRDKAKPRENWIQHEKESLRKAVLSFGIGRWAKLRMSLRPASRPRHDSRDVQLATWDLIRAMHRRLEPDSAEARYLADRLKRESPGGERLPADPFVGSWNLGSRAKLNAANCKVWTRRVRTIEMINRSVDRLLAEETQEDAIALAGACPLPASDVKRSLPVWWDGTCDFFLLYGVYRHGFGNFHSVRSDPWALAVATEAARSKGGDAAVAQLRESIAAIDEHHRLYLQAREHHGAAITAGAAAKRKEDKAEEEDDGDAEGDETDTEHAMHVTTPGGDKSELANAKERAERLHEGENAWPRPEDLTDRVRRVAKDLGDPGALKPSDPPWVQCVLGHKRRVPKPSMSTAERAAREVKRGAMRSKASDADGAAEEQDGAMTRGEWDCLGADGADASVGKLLCADHPGFNALTGVNPEADESVRSLIHSLRESGITTRVRKDVLKALMRHGLPRRADHAPDWTALGANAGIARDVGTIQRVFHATACEMRVLEARTAVTGLKAASKGEIRSGKTHAPGCKCIVCRIRVAKTTAADPTKVGWRDAVKAMKDGGVKDGGGDASPQGENTAASSPAADGNEDEHDEGNDDDDDDEGHDNDNDDDGNDEDEGDDEGDDAGLKKEPGDNPDGGDTPVKGSQDEKGSSRRRGGGAPFGLLTAITANRLRERLDMTQTLRMCLEKNNGTMAGLPMPVIKTGELPRWWTPGVHDIAVLRAAMKHGCDGWSELAADPQFTSIFGKSRPVPKGPLCFRVLRIATRALRRGYLGLGKHTKRKKGVARW